MGTTNQPTNEPTNQPTNKSPFGERANVLGIGNQILGLLGQLTDYTMGLEMLGEVMASYIQRTQPELQLDKALGASILAVTSVYMPASKYNGLDFDDDYLDLGTWEAQLGVMQDFETFPNLNNGTVIEEYPFQYETSYHNVADEAADLAGDYGTGMTIQQIATHILEGTEKHGMPINPPEHVIAWAHRVYERLTKEG